MIGPPKVPPNWLNRSGGLKQSAVCPDVHRVPLGSFRGSGCRLRKYSFASKTSLRTYSQALPWKALVPDLVTRLLIDPALLPYCADMFNCNCWNSCTLSWIGTRSTPPLRPLLETPL